MEEITNTPAISTMLSLQEAGAVAVNSANWPNGVNSAVQNMIQNYVNAGLTVIAPKATSTLGSGTTTWSGAGYALEDADNIVQFYILSGGMDGKTTTEYGANNGGPATTIISPPDLLTGTTVGEPVNPANGDVTHDETDFSIPNLGTPLEMVRQYDSFNTSASGTRQPRQTGAWVMAGRSPTATR